MKKTEAIRLREIIEEAVQSLNDETALEGITLFPKMKKDGNIITAGTRINYNGTLKRAKNDIIDNEDNTPDNNPELWEDVTV